jgi:flagellar biosynthesis/type III secretory pathway protein FliH
MPKKGKNVLAIMLGGKSHKKKGRHEEEEDDEYEEEEDDDYGEAFKESAKAAFEAANEGDEEGFVSSLKDAIVTCVEEFHEEGGE